MVQLGALGPSGRLLPHPLFPAPHPPLHNYFMWKFSSYLAIVLIKKKRGETVSLQSTTANQKSLLLEFYSSLCVLWW